MVCRVLQSSLVFAATTAEPGPVSGQTPTTKRHQDGAGQSTTARPVLVSGKTPTAAPGPVTGKTPTAHPGPVTGQTPTSQPSLCGWSQWMDNHKPDEFAGESETFSDLRTIHQFCNDEDIQVKNG